MKKKVAKETVVCCNLVFPRFENHKWRPVSCSAVATYIGRSDNKTAAHVYSIESYYHKAVIEIATISEQNYKIITDKLWR